MNKNYIISITGIQTIEGEIEKIEFTTTGEYKIDKSNRYIKYKEYDETGQNSDVLLKIENDKIVTLNRSGFADPDLILEKGKRYMCSYNTDMGSFLLGVFTNTFECNLGKMGGSLLLEYTLNMSGSVNISNTLLVEVKKIKSKGETKNNVEINDRSR